MLKISLKKKERERFNLQAQPLTCSPDIITSPPLPPLKLESHFEEEGRDNSTLATKPRYRTEIKQTHTDKRNSQTIHSGGERLTRDIIFLGVGHAIQELKPPSRVSVRIVCEHFLPTPYPRGVLSLSNFYIMA
ncbi:hypothetical protein CDAR_580491 [Caerostris darwini]|uniref:Uncharacterized protein n=1 Tax=Caerostris darwini TaxID=1538125 RepID=A0AAV4R7Y0_9ARAC|nr:hypothetical protein CDAR_580491 [Caerostris darwini]